MNLFEHLYTLGLIMPLFCMQHSCLLFPFLSIDAFIMKYNYEPTVYPAMGSTNMKETGIVVCKEKWIMAALIEKTSWKQKVLELKTSGKGGWLRSQRRCVGQHSKYSSEKKKAFRKIISTMISFKCILTHPSAIHLLVDCINTFQHISNNTPFLILSLLYLDYNHLDNPCPCS